MAKLTIHLSATEEKYVSEQAEGGHFRSADEYVSHLILMDQLRHRRAVIDSLLREGLQGPFTPFSEQDLQDIEREGLEKLAEEKGNGRQNPKKQQRSKRPA